MHAHSDRQAQTEISMVPDCQTKVAAEVSSKNPKTPLWRVAKKPDGHYIYYLELSSGCGWGLRKNDGRSQLLCLHVEGLYIGFRLCLDLWHGDADYHLQLGASVLRF